MCWETTAIVERAITMSMSATEVSRRVIVACRSATAIHPLSDRDFAPLDRDAGKATTACGVSITA